MSTFVRQTQLWVLFVQITPTTIVHRRLALFHESRVKRHGTHILGMPLIRDFLQLRWNKDIAIVVIGILLQIIVRWCDRITTHCLRPNVARTWLAHLGDLLIHLKLFNFLGRRCQILFHIDLLLPKIIRLLLNIIIMRCHTFPNVQSLFRRTNFISIFIQKFTTWLFLFQALKDSVRRRWGFFAHTFSCALAVSWRPSILHYRWSCILNFRFSFLP